MREILFRGKSISHGMWVIGDYTEHAFNERPTICDECGWDNVDPNTVGQFTGMFDAGGKKIFEGDIMTTAVGGLKINTGVVEFSDGAFGLRCISGDALFLCFVAGSFMVIGNIHDDPELMKTDEE